MGKSTASCGRAFLPASPPLASFGGLMRKTMVAGLAAFTIFSPTKGFAMAGPDPFSGLESVGSDELAARRGGFSAAGIDVSFGAVVRTVVNGTTVLETQFTLTPDGMMASQSGPATTSNMPIAGMPDLKVTVVDGTPGSAGGLTEANVGASALNGARGVIVTGPNGVSAALSTVSTMQVANVIVNSASGQAINQQIEVNIALNNFMATQQQIVAGQMGGQIASNVQSALASTISR